MINNMFCQRILYIVQKNSLYITDLIVYPKNSKAKGAVTSVSRFFAFFITAFKAIKHRAATKRCSRISTISKTAVYSRARLERGFVLVRDGGVQLGMRNQAKVPELVERQT